MNIISKVRYGVRLKCLKIMVLGLLRHCLRVRISLVVSGFLRSSIGLMVLLSVKKLILLFLVIIKRNVLISVRHLKMVIVCSFLEVVVSHDWEVHQMDVHNAFLFRRRNVHLFSTWFSNIW